VRDGIAHEMDERVGNLLNDLLSSSVSLPVRSSSTCLPAESGGIADARDKREYNVRMGTMRAAVNSSCK